MSVPSPLVKQSVKEYECFFFRQRQNSPVQCTFVATSADISDWSSVPQKAAGELRNFQRPEIPEHVNEIAEFFKNFDDNSSPSAIVLGFRAPVPCLTREKQILDLATVKYGQLVPGYIQVPLVEIESATTIAEKRDILKTLREMLVQSNAQTPATA